MRLELLHSLFTPRLRVEFTSTLPPGRAFFIQDDTLYLDRALVMRHQRRVRRKIARADSRRFARSVKRLTLAEVLDFLIREKKR